MEGNEIKQYYSVPVVSVSCPVRRKVAPKRPGPDTPRLLRSLPSHTRDKGLEGLLTDRGLARPVRSSVRQGHDPCVSGTVLHWFRTLALDPVLPSWSLRPNILDLVQFPLPSSTRRDSPPTHLGSSPVSDNPLQEGPGRGSPSSREGHVPNNSRNKKKKKKDRGPSSIFRLSFGES